MPRLWLKQGQGHKRVTCLLPVTMKYQCKSDGYASFERRDISYLGKIAIVG